MKKNAFTLIELLAVIIILAIISIIVFPVIQDSINNSKIKTCNEQTRTIENAAKRWAAEHDTKLARDCKNGNISSSVSIAELKSAGYLSSNQVISNPTGKSVPQRVEIKYDCNNKQYNYRYSLDCSLN